MITIDQLDGSVNLTVTKDNLLSFAEYLIQNYSGKDQRENISDQMNVAQVANYLNFSRPTIYKMVSNHEIPFYKGKVKGKILFKKSEIDIWLAGFKKQTASDFHATLDGKYK